MNVDGNKVSGPDGFPFKFNQKFWPEFQEGILSLFNYFFEAAEFN